MIRVYYTYLRLSYGKSKTLKKNKDVLIVSVSFRITKDLKMKSELYEITVVHNKSTVFNSFQFEKTETTGNPGLIDHGRPVYQGISCERICEFENIY